MFDTMARNTLVPLILRFMLAAIFIFHGLDLVSEKNDWGSNWMKGPDAQPAVVQLVVAWGELLGGVALAVGFLTRIAAIGLIAIMAGAIYLVHWKNNFDIQKGGYEYNLAIIAMCLCLVLTGGGPLSVDRLFFRRRRPA